MLVCGSRDYTDRKHLWDTLDQLHAITPIGLVIEGGARGADRLARAWAIARGIEFKAYPADWKRYKKRAGPIRNQQMLDEAHPDAVVAFPLALPLPEKGSGTADMVNRATDAGVHVRVIEPRTRPLDGENPPTHSGRGVLYSTSSTGDAAIRGLRTPRTSWRACRSRSRPTPRRSASRPGRSESRTCSRRRG